MSTDAQFLQTQLNELQITLSAQNILTQQAIESAGENKRALKTAHERLDTICDSVTLMESNQLTVNDIEAVMQVSFNKRLVTGLRGIFVTGLGVTITALVAWAIEHLTGK